MPHAQLWRPNAYETLAPQDHESACSSNNCNVLMPLSGDYLCDKFFHNSDSIDQCVKQISSFLSAGETNATRWMYQVCLYWLDVPLIFIELCCVKKLISVIDPRVYTSLSCCQMSCFGVKLLLLILLDVSCVFFFFPLNFHCSDESFIGLNLQNIFSLLQKSRGVFLRS